MEFTMFNRTILFILLSLLIASTSQAGWGNKGWRGEPGQSNEQEPNTISEQDVSQGLSTQEAEDLSYLREEEKVARDVYLSMYERWGLYAFSNISNAEQNHMNATLNMLNQYGLVDPAVDQRGVFTNPELQQLFDTLIAKGSESEIAALMTGALIEEVDIQDIDEMIAATDKTDLISMYEKLHCGSRNHLRSFVRQIENRGQVYSAQVLSQDIVDSIVDSPMERRCGAGGM
jgi:hypothetical protein